MGHKSNPIQVLYIYPLVVLPVHHPYITFVLFAAASILWSVPSSSPRGGVFETLGIAYVDFGIKISLPFIALCCLGCISATVACLKFIAWDYIFIIFALLALFQSSILWISEFRCTVASPIVSF